MTPRKWFTEHAAFNFIDDMQAEARTRSIICTTYSLHADDAELYVFTELELNQFAEHWYWTGCPRNPDKTSIFPWEVAWEEEWQQKFGGRDD